MSPATPAQVVVALVVALVGALVVAVSGWMEARRGERHAVARAMLAEREERRAWARAARIEVATEAVKQAATVLAEQDMARHLDGWDGLRRACRSFDRVMSDDETQETVNPVRM